MIKRTPYMYQIAKVAYLQGALFGNTKVGFQLPELQPRLVDLNLLVV